MRFYWLAVGILAVWRITHLLNVEDGPGDILVRLRRLIGNGFWASLVDCFYCLSVWIAAPFAYSLGDNWKERVLLWPALSGAAILVERLTSSGDVKDAPSAVHFEEPEDPDVVLRSEARTIRGAGRHAG